MKADSLQKDVNATCDRLDEFVIADSTGYLINAAARLFARALQQRITRHGISIGQWPLLMFLWEEDGITQIELSRRIKIDAATTLRAIDRLEQDGLVCRVRDSRDRRRIKLFLTPKGRGLRERLIPYAMEVNALAKQGFTDEEQVRVNGLLTRMIDNLLKDTGEL